MTPRGVTDAGIRWTCTTSSADQTWDTGRVLGACLEGGEVLTLDGELGMGKTRFVQGLADGLGIPPDHVTSPTFAVRHDHQGRLPLAHLDFYRLVDPDEIDWLDLLDGVPQTVIAIEWAEKLPTTLPADRLSIRFTPGPASDDRTITWSPTGPVAERTLRALRARHGT
ncbi:MAG: tRNA (adenosine(37)-N6)-threonylcarbamoyltransferase complex ATPase subunit type 1 TsaE [Nitrospirae bacterium]|nr:tRNA (adenosine(37)-N6)-threonylcarbamoyltransferase complex ATPase subunit type 1 TsaE [Nitrospirota bacterium]